MHLFNSKKGVFTLRNLGIFFFDLIVFVVFLPSINMFIEEALPFLAGNTMGLWIIKLIPLALLLALTLGIFGNRHEGQAVYIQQ